jgi:hypothetical protein
MHVCTDGFRLVLTPLMMREWAIAIVSDTLPTIEFMAEINIA